MALGVNTTASGYFSTAFGYQTTAKSAYEMVLGSWNTEYTPFSTYLWNATDRLFIIGNGTDALSRSDAMTILKNGNVGIGNSNPGFLLDVSGRMLLRGNMGGNSAGMWFNNENNTAQSFFVGMQNDDKAGFYGNGGIGWGLTMDRNNGNVNVAGKLGIGTAATATPLSFPPTLEKKITLYPGATGDVGMAVRGNYFQIYSDNSSATVGIGYQQNALISGGNPTGFQYNLNVFGNGDATLRGVFTHASDARLKKDISPIQNSLQKIIQLNGYNYYWKNENADKNLQTGVIAQEVQKLFPHLVKEDKDGLLSVNYSGLIPVLIEGIKEQQKQIETFLKHDIEQQQQIDELKKLVENLLKQ
jgi:hypothetical protein